jgi:hypothetical protein
MAIIIGSVSTSGGGANISDAAYGAGWNGNTTDGASKNALYDIIAATIASIPVLSTDFQLARNTQIQNLSN